MITAVDIAWVAGIVEGEGCFGFSNWNKMTQRGGGYFISVRMCDRDVIERLARYWGSTVTVRKFKNPKWKTSYGAQVSGTKCAQWAMTMYSQLGERRRAKVRALLAHWRVRRHNKIKTHCPKGHPYTTGTNARLSVKRDGKPKRNCRACESSPLRNAQREVWRKANPAKVAEYYRRSKARRRLRVA